MDNAFWTEVVCKGLRVYYVWPRLSVDVAQILTYDDIEKTVNLAVFNDDPDNHDGEVIVPLVYIPFVRYAPIGPDGTLVPNTWHL